MAPALNLQLPRRMPSGTVGSFLLLSAVTFAFFLSMGFTYPVLSLRFRELGASYGDIGLIQAAMQITSLGSLVFWGSHSSLLNRRKPVALLGLIGVAIGHLLLYETTVLWAVFLVRAFDGISWAAYNVTSLTMIGDVLERRQVRGWLLGAWRTCGSLSYGLAAFFAGDVIAAFDLRTCFLFAMVIDLVAILLLLVFVETPALRPIASTTPACPTAVPVVQAEPPTRRGWRAGFAVATGFVPFLVASLSYSLLARAGEPLLPVYLVERGIREADTVRLFSLSAICEIPFMLLGGHLADRLGRRQVASSAFFVAAIAFGLWSLLPRQPWVAVAMVAWGAAFATFTAASMLYATELTGRQGRGRSVSLYNMSSSIGGLAGSAVGGGLGQALGLGPMFQLCAAFAFLAGVSALRTLPKSKPTAPGDLAPIGSPATS